MYLIIGQQICSYEEKRLDVLATDDMQLLNDALKKGWKAYKMDSLSEIKDVEVTYKEITMEMRDE